MVYYLLSLFFMTAGVSAGVCNKTVIDTVPRLPASALSTLPLKMYLQERAGFRTLQGASLQVHLDYARSFKGGSYARALSPFGDENVLIGTTSNYSKTLDEFAFVHNQGEVHSLDATVNLNPHFKKTTLMARLLLPINKWHPSCFADVMVNYKNLDYGINVGLSGGKTSPSADGQPISFAEYFAGTLTQRTAEKQTALSHAKFGSKLNKRGLGDVNLTVGYKRALGKESFVTTSAKASFAASHRRYAENLGDLTLSDFPNHTLGVASEALFCLSKKHYSDIFFGITGEAGIILPYYQSRTLGFKDNNLAAVPWSSLRLLAQSGTAGVTPAANILTKRLSIKTRTYGNVGAVFDGRFSCVDMTLGYNAHACERESVSYADAPWKENMYAVPAASYNSTVAFGGAGTFAYEDNAYIGVEGLDFAPATAEGFLAHTVSLGVSLSGVMSALHLRIAAGGSYTFSGSAVQESWSASTGLFINF